MDWLSSLFIAERLLMEEIRLLFSLGRSGIVSFNLEVEM